MNTEEWHSQYGRALALRDKQARHCADLQRELDGELQKLASLEQGLVEMRRSDPALTAVNQS